MGGWVGWVEEEQPVRMSYCTWCVVCVGGCVGGWVGYLQVGIQVGERRSSEL